MAKNANRDRGRSRVTRLRDTEELMVRGVARRTIHQSLCERYGVKSTTVDNWIGAVRDAWVVESAGVDRTEMRSQHRARLSKVYERAMTRRMPVRDADGNPVLHNGSVVTAEIPDLRVSVRALDALAKLDNLNEETTKLDAGSAEDLVGFLRLGAVAAKRKIKLDDEDTKREHRARRARESGGDAE